jgi:hypothetical protein
MGKAGRILVEQRFGMHTWARQLADIYAEATPVPARLAFLDCHSPTLIIRNEEQSEGVLQPAKPRPKAGCLLVVGLVSDPVHSSETVSGPP